MKYNTMHSCTRFLANWGGGTLLAVLFGATLAACSHGPVVTKEGFSVDSPYQRKLAFGAVAACEGARRALLGDGYVIDSATTDKVKGRKAYRSDADRSTFIEMSAVCVPDPKGSTLYANGLLSTYEVKKSTISASVGVSAIGSVSVPVGRSADSMVKISDQTINDRDFYQRFFIAVRTALHAMEPEGAEAATQPLPKAAPISASPLPPSPPKPAPAPAASTSPAGPSPAGPAPQPAAPTPAAPVPTAGDAASQPPPQDSQAETPLDPQSETPLDPQLDEVQVPTQ